MASGYSNESIKKYYTVQRETVVNSRPAAHQVPPSRVHLSVLLHNSGKLFPQRPTPAHVPWIQACCFCQCSSALCQMWHVSLCILIGGVRCSCVLSRVKLTNRAFCPPLCSVSQANLDESQMSSSPFLRALMTAVCKAAVKGKHSATRRTDSSILLKSHLRLQFYTLPNSAQRALTLPPALPNRW